MNYNKRYMSYQQITMAMMMMMITKETTFDWENNVTSHKVLIIKKHK